MAVKFFLPAKKKEENLSAAQVKKAKTKNFLALVLGFVIGMECGFMGSAGGVLMLVALTGAVSHVAMGADLELIPSIVMTVACTVGAVGSSRFANKVEEKTLNRAAGVVLLVVSVVSLLLSA